MAPHYLQDKRQIRAQPFLWLMLPCFLANSSTIPRNIHDSAPMMSLCTLFFSSSCRPCPCPVHMYSLLFYCSQSYPSPSASLGDSLSTPVTECLVLSRAFGWKRFPNQTMYFRPDMGATRHDLDPTISWHSKGKSLDSGSSPVLPLFAL